MSIYLHQAGIGDDPTFQLRVRQAIIKLAMTVAVTPTSTVPQRELAQAVLEKPDRWAVQIARGLATNVAALDVTVDTITDAQIDSLLVAAFAAYLVAS